MNYETPNPQELVDFIFQNAPLHSDAEENETILRCFIALYNSNKETVAKHSRNATLACLKVLVDDKCKDLEETFKRDVVAAFFKQHLMGEQMEFLQEMEAKMSEDEKAKLAKYLS